MTIGQETRGSIPHVELKICPEGKDAIPRVESTTTLFCDLNTRQPNNAAACINGRLSRCGTALSFALTQQCPSCERTQQDIDVSTLGSNRTSEAVQKLVICWFGQRRVGVVGGRGGSEDQSCKHQTYLPFARFAPLGTRGASSVRSDPSNRNTSGRLGYDLNWPRTIETWRSSTWPSTANCAAAIWSK